MYEVEQRCADKVLLVQASAVLHAGLTKRIAPSVLPVPRSSRDMDSNRASAAGGSMVGAGSIAAAERKYESLRFL